MNQARTTLKNQIESFVDKEDWIEVIRLLPNEEEISKNVQLTRFAGIAYSNIGREPYNYQTLEKSVNLLKEAWLKGDKSSEVIWPLTRTLYEFGEQHECTRLLDEYISLTEIAHERVSAGAYQSTCWEVIGDYEKAVEAHKIGLAGIGANADPLLVVKESLSGHVVSAYQNQNSSEDWLNLVLDTLTLVPGIEELDQLSQMTMISGFCATVNSHNTKSVERCLKIVNAIEKQLAKNSIVSDSCEHLEYEDLSSPIYLQISKFYLVIDQISNSEKSLLKAQKIAEGLYQLATIPGQNSETKHSAFIALANLGMTGELVKIDESIRFLKKADEIAVSPCGPISFWLAGQMLFNQGALEDALYHFKRVIRDKKWALGGMCVRPQDEFYKHRFFAAVREDKRFTQVVDSWRGEGA